MNDFSILEQINNEIEKDISLNPSNTVIEELKHENVLSSNTDTINKIEKERAYVSTETINVSNNPYLKKDIKTERIEYKNPEVINRNTSSNYGSQQQSQSNQTQTNRGYAGYYGGYYGGYQTQSQTEKDKEERIKREARTYSENVLKNLAEQAKKDLKEKKYGGENWDIFELQQKSQKRRLEKKKSRDKNHKNTNKDRVKLTLLRIGLCFCKSIIELSYQERNR